ncbi:hypothetical protein A3A25_02075 [Candidatus Azambacteria bacterium RIFCSPLOWO2_01_FULL_46_26]|uniref:Sugar kinase n=3 Tax=Candidatus Azamiibacteriota TaxID=1752741 RepID=A0A1F5C9C8_9BACT|nr:MAG: hypothetical protein A3A25_02075 [Candidatus Azambacteria bacterium RIFCSPLOWO2_01_FULL_46_26]
MNMPNKQIFSIGVDVGGSKINAMLFDLRKNEIVRRQTIATPKKKKKLLNQLIQLIENVIAGVPKSRIAGIGLGIAGEIDFQKGILLNSPNLKFLNGTRPARTVEKYFKLKTGMDNDANCFALAEARLGAGRSFKNVVGITLGTGVGGGIVINGSLYHGAFGSAGEVGWMILDGTRTFEDLASEKFIKSISHESPINLEAKARRGDKKALKVYETLGTNLGLGIANIVNVMDPELIILGGGLASAAGLFLPQARKMAKKYIISPLSRRKLKIVLAKLGKNAGAVGAALLCQ